MTKAELIELRKDLHKNPELSGREKETSNRIIEILKSFSPDQMITGIGGYGVAAKFPAVERCRETLLFRAELDAISVEEETGLDYASQTRDVMHGCGHDGHMAILIGFAQEISTNRPHDKDIWILFQPAEETGEGAAEMLADPKFDEVKADHAFAVHNLPGFEENQVLVKEGVFAAASVGLDVSFKGKSSHAAHPEEGVNPSDLLGELLVFANREFEQFKSGGPINKIVTTYLKMGERAFGISPGNGSVGFTVRSESDEMLEQAVDKVTEKVDELRNRFKGQISIETTEPFSATVNHAEGVERVKSAAREMGLKMEELENPFPWSEDFGEFGKRFPITLFGLGTGVDHPPLHSEMYDFNDKLIEKGIRLFRGIVESDNPPPGK